MGASQWDIVNFNKNKVWNICIRLFATCFYHYPNFFKLAHDAFCKQTLHLLHVVGHFRKRAIDAVELMRCTTF